MVEYIVELNTGRGWTYLKHFYETDPYRFATKAEAEYYLKLTVVGLTPEQFRIVSVKK